ncbi:MAG: hypothetical protein WEB51_06930 [Mycobacterium sp.]
MVEIVSPVESHERLLGAVPAMRSACADWLQPGMLDAALPPAHQLGEFLADWALQALTFVRGYLQDAGCARDPRTGQVLVWLGFHEPRLSLMALDLAARWLSSLAEGQATAQDWGAALDRLWRDCRQRHPDYQARIVMEASRRRGVPYAPAWGMARFWRFGQGERSRVLFETSSCADGYWGTQVASSKATTKTVLRSLGLPTPAFRLVTNGGELQEAVAAVGFPCVTKPLDRGGGKGVSTGLLNLAAVRDGFAAARAYTDGPVMVEAHAVGNDYRLMVVDGRLAAAIRREPPTVTGDGRRTIRELVIDRNAGRDARSLVRSGYLSPIQLDASAQLHLTGLGLNPDTVLDYGRTIRVRSNSNRSTGAACVDVTTQTHPTIRVFAEALGRTLNVRMLGVDYLTTDIGQSAAASGGQFIEINATPGLAAMMAAGWSAEQAGDLALGEAPARIPVQLLVVRYAVLTQALAAARARVWTAGSGWAAWGQAADAGAELSVDANVPWAGVRALLGHRTVASAVVVVSERQIYQHGLPLDAFDVAHVTCNLTSEWGGVLQRCCQAVQHQSYSPDDSLAWLEPLMDSLG